MSTRMDVINRKRFIGLWVCLALCSGGGASADPLQAGEERSQESSPGGDTPQLLGTITVTGSHIRGVDIETEHPLVVLERNELLRTGLTGIADIVQSLIVANGQTLNRNINNGGSGELRVNLRSLGANRTLVLVNGQRWVSAVDGAVDLSAIPPSLVERIEVLKDGASAVYGSDAIGGVINIITRKDYNGAELGVYAGESEHDDGLGRHADFSFGRNGERWNAAFGVEWGDDAPVFAGARQISSVPAPGLPLNATGSLANQYGAFGIPEFPGNGAGVLIAGRPGTSPDDFRPVDYATDENFNYAPFNYLQTPQQRRAGFGQFRWNFSPSLAFTADVLFNQRRSAQQLAPPVVFFSSYLAPGTSAAFDVSAQNVYNPFGEDTLFIYTRWPDDEPRRFEQSVNTAHLHLGLEGVFDALGRNWIWNAEATRTRAAQSESGGPYADNAKLALAVGPSFHDAAGVARCGTPDDVIADCVPLDLFTGPGRFAQAMLDGVNVDVINHKRARSDALHLGATTAMADLPAGPLSFAAGLERRLERGDDVPDPLVASGRANGTGVSYLPTHGAYGVNEMYLEFDIPLLTDRPFARELDVNLATRYSDYSLFGGTDNSRAGLRWKPLDDLLFRATWAQGFRAPSIFEAFGGEETESSGAFDPCAPRGSYVPPPAVATNCAAHGVPVDVTPPDIVFVSSGGNRDLHPETSRSVSAGWVYSPHWLEGLDASLDWYRIQIRDAIGNPGAQFFVDNCYNFNDAAACARVTRLPNGQLAGIQSTNENIPGGLEAEGWDFALDWKRATRFGNFNLRWDNAYVSYWGPTGKPAQGTLLPDGSLASGNVAGSNDPLYGVVWRLRSVASLAWQREAFGASVSARYFSPVKEDCSFVTNIADVVGDPSLYALCSDPDHVIDGVPAPQNRVGAVTYVDFQVNWDTSWKARATFGIRNALDRDPPHAWSYSSMNSFFPDYDIPGRFLYVSYRQKF